MTPYEFAIVVCACFAVAFVFTLFSDEFNNRDIYTGESLDD